MARAVLNRLSRLFGLVTHLTGEERAEVRKGVDEAGGPTSRFWVLLVLATVIAGFGLLTNSAAVIIGAMIIAPLMGPILASALAIDAGDNRLLIKALTAEVFGVAAAVLIGVLIGVLPMNLGVTSEMLARTTPTLFDLFIAAASGLAAGYAMVDRKVSSALAGVAISVALVPPLATCGLFLAMAQPGNARGAFLLFFANFLAIQIAAGLVFFLFRVADVPHWERKEGLKQLVRFGPSLVLLLFVGVFMTSTLINLVNEKNLEKTIDRVLNREIGARTGGQLDRVIRRGQGPQGYEVIAVALTPQPFDPDQVSKIENVLRREARSDIHLIVRSLSSSDADSQGQVFLTESQLNSQREREADQTLLSMATDVLNVRLAKMPGAHLVNMLKTQGEGVHTFVAVVRTPIAITPDEVAEVQANLSAATGKTAKLTVRSVLTREADAQRFLYETREQVKLPPEEQALRDRIRVALASRVDDIPGAVLKEVSITVNDNEHVVFALVDAPQLISPETVAQYQQDFKTFIDPGIRLEIRTTLTATATAGGYTSTR